MDRQTIINQISEFKNQCEILGRKLNFCALVPEMENYENTSYVLQVYGIWFVDKPCSEIFDILVPILFANTSIEIREKIYRINIYDEHGNLHCRFNDLIIANEIGYNPLLIRSESH